MALIEGTTGSDTLDGSATEQDVLVGGPGDDTYLWHYDYFNFGTPGQCFTVGTRLFCTPADNEPGMRGDIIEEDPGEGYDTVELFNSEIRTVLVGDIFPTPITLNASIRFDLEGTNLEAAIARTENTVWRLFGTDDANLLVASLLNDVLEGRRGNDTLRGDDGNDTMRGGLDQDRLEGGDGDDSLEAGGGHDTVLGGDGTDTLLGGKGHDWLEGQRGSDLLQGGAGDDTLLGQGGDDVLVTGDGGGMVDGGRGIDLAIFAPGTRVDLSTGIATTGSGAEIVTRGVEFYTGEGVTLLGSSQAELITTFTDDERVEAGNGDDTVDGAEGNDTLLGQRGNDEIYGQEGDDDLYGNNGNDTLFGSSGNDRATGGAGADILAGNEGNDRLNGEDGRDTAIGGGGDDTLRGGQGNDLLVGDTTEETEDVVPGRDVLFGGRGQDTLAGGDGNDSLRGDNSDDVLFGDAGADTLDGGKGHDTLVGGDGGDVLTGGTWADRFEFAPDRTTIRGEVFEEDAITDFEIEKDIIGISTLSGAAGYDPDTQLFLFPNQRVQYGKIYQEGDDAVIRLGSGNAQLDTFTALNIVVRLIDIDVADLTADHFLFLG
ncbi:MAG: calcium-binding protein [Pseudomonadota bacterium]